MSVIRRGGGETEKKKQCTQLKSSEWITAREMINNHPETLSHTIAAELCPHTPAASNPVYRVTTQEVDV